MSRHGYAIQEKKSFYNDDPPIGNEIVNISCVADMFCFTNLSPLLILLMLKIWHLRQFSLQNRNVVFKWIKWLMLNSFWEVAPINALFWFTFVHYCIIESDHVWWVLGWGPLCTSFSCWTFPQIVLAGDTLSNSPVHFYMLIFSYDMFWQIHPRLLFVQGPFTVFPFECVTLLYSLWVMFSYPFSKKLLSAHIHPETSGCDFDMKPEQHCLLPD